MKTFTANLLPEKTLSLNDKQDLRTRLDAFYQRVTDYIDFNKVSNKPLYWEPIVKAIRQRKTNNRLVRILEIGAGRSGFSAFLSEKSVRDLVHYTAQDITSQNKDWLASQADELLIGDISTLPSRPIYDIVFSTFVFEHVTDPGAHLGKVVKLINDKGSLFIFCPRYDVPGYLCPSSRHLRLTKQIEFSIRCSLTRFTSLLVQRPAFLIQTDLAAFHQPFFEDSDAVHWVSLFDIQLWAKANQLSVHPIQLISFRGTSLKNWFVKRWLTCAVQLQKQ